MQPDPTVRERIRSSYETLTQAERKLANALLSNYPAAGLASITIVAGTAEVSTPTVARMVQKLGFKGFPAFHEALRQELKAAVFGPAQRRANWADEVPDTHMLNRFADAVMKNLGHTLSNIDTEAFDTAVQQLANKNSRIFVVGGRITGALAGYAFTHLQAIRPRVTHMTSSSATWPHYVLDMAAGDTLLVFDVRRYETNLLHLAELAASRGIKVILITDQWASPIAKVASQTFNCWVDIPSAWDSNTSTMMLLEALISATQEQDWPQTESRFERLESLFDTTRLFRKST